MGLLSIGTDPSIHGRWQAFDDAMRSLNYVEGRNLVILRGFGASKFERMDGFLADFIGAKVDAIARTDASSSSPVDAQS